MQNYSYSPEIEIQGASRVNSFQAAMQYPVAPLARVILWDAPNNRLYIRSGSQTGLEPLVAYEEVPNQQRTLPMNSATPYNQMNNDYQNQNGFNNGNSYNNQPPQNFVTRQEYEMLQRDLMELRDAIRGMRNVPIQQ